MSRQAGISALPAKAAATNAPAKSAAQGTALAALAKVPVKGRAPKTGYSRAQFGQAWADVNRNGCDTRNDILARDLTSRTVKAGTHGCVIASGVLNDPYTAKYIHFTRGNGTSTAVQIDHVVALSDAWQTGAQKLSSTQRRQLANDPLELLAVDGPTNEKKGDGDAATWLPANKSFRCQYVARQVAVKVRYKLWVTPAEHDAIYRVLSGCKGQKLPGAGAPVVVWKASGSAKTAAAKKTVVKAPAKKAAVAKKTTAKKAAAKAPAKKKTVAKKTVAKKTVAKKTTAKKKVPAKSTAKKSAVYYKNCAAAKKAGAAPLYRGHPGYRPALDRDNDGIACEWH
ncbi:GmrSD restriction endonuclease domain-containing protein [Acidipropionibacterium thoenii]|uniref:GmrSD restriction endonuclease domain-containing protein n=1 Tax=Acidipropionibacterium thoenii TaxID=1751 RepID=UPI0012B6230A